MSDRNSPPPNEEGGTTPRTPTFDRDTPSYNPTPNEELVTPPPSTTVPRDRLVPLPFWKIKAQSREFSSMLVYRPTKEQLTEKVNDAVKKITDVKPSKTKLKLKVNRITLTASWKWRDSKDDDACGICRGAFEACCTNCKLPGDSCPLALGDCKHSFHLHCINKWLDSQPNPSCPLCRTEWKSTPSQRRRSRSPSARRSSASPQHMYSRTPSPNGPGNNSITVSPPQLNYPSYAPDSPIINPSNNNSSIISSPQLNSPTYSPHSPIYHPMGISPTYTPGPIPHSPVSPIYDPMEEH